MDEDSRDDIYIDVRYVAALRPTGRFLSSHMCFALPHFHRRDELPRGARINGTARFPR